MEYQVVHRNSIKDIFKNEYTLQKVKSKQVYDYDSDYSDKDTESYVLLHNGYDVDSIIYSNGFLCSTYLKLKDGTGIDLWPSNLNVNEEHLRTRKNPIVSPKLNVIAHDYIVLDSDLMEWANNLPEGAVDKEALESSVETFHVDNLYYWSNCNIPIERIGKNRTYKATAVGTVVIMSDTELNIVRDKLKELDDDLAKRAIAALESSKDNVNSKNFDNLERSRVVGYRLLKIEDD